MRRALLVSLLAALALAPSALAHATLIGSVPADGAVLAAAPSAVHLTFDDTVRAAGGAAIRNADGTSVLAGEIHNPRGKPRELVVPLRADLPKGDYTVRWRVLSDDGHLISGVLAFAVGRGSTPPTAALSAGGGGPSGWDVLERWLVLAGVALTVGGSAVAAFVAPRARGSRTLPAVLLTGFVVAFLGLVSTLWASDAEASTRFGRVSLAGAIVALAGAALALLALERRRLWLLAALASLALAAVPPVRGHPLDPGQPRALNLALDLVHELAVAFWLGGAAAVLLLRDRTATRRFVVGAVVLLPVLGGTGVARGFFELSAPDQLWTSGYGQALLVKTGLGLLALPLLWRALAPVARGTAGPTAPLAGQAVLLVGALAAVSVMTDLRPGRVPARATPPSRPSAPARPAPPPKPPLGWLSLGAESEELAVGLSLRPQGRGRLVLRAQVIDGEGHGLAGLDVRFRTGSRTTDAAPCRPGCYAATAPFAPRVVLSLSGPGRKPAAIAFDLPRQWPPRPAPALLDRATRTFRALPAVDFSERLASNEQTIVRSTWRLEAPNRLRYTIANGPQAIVIGARRWDRQPGGRWVASAQDPLPQPTPPWGDAKLSNEYLLGEATLRGTRVLVVAFVDRSLPIWYRAYVEPRSGRTLALDMTAAAHFMRDDFVRFGGRREIFPPAR